MDNCDKRFNKHILKCWEPKVKALLICDIFGVHIFQVKKYILVKDSWLIFLCFPPSVNEGVQPIDAGYSRSQRCSTGRLLDECLMKSYHV